MGNMVETRKHSSLKSRKKSELWKKLGKFRFQFSIWKVVCQGQFSERSSEQNVDVTESIIQLISQEGVSERVVQQRAYVLAIKFRSRFSTLTGRWSHINDL